MISISIFALVIMTLFFVFGLVGLVLKLTGKVVGGILKIIFHPGMFVMAVLVVAVVYFMM